MKQNLPAYRRVYGEIRSQIQTGAIKVGEKLPSETELAKQMGVSRITSRRALQMLENEGLLLRSPGRGTVVCECKEKPRIIGLAIAGFDSLFGLNFVRGVLDEAAENQCLVIVQSGYFVSSHERSRLQQLVDADVCGIIDVPMYESQHRAEDFSRICGNVPLVLADRDVRGLDAPLVCTDNYGATWTLCQKLYESGHRKIAFFSSSLGSTAVESRYKGYQAFCEQMGLRDYAQMTFTNIHYTLPGMGRKDVWQSDVEEIKRFLTSRKEVTAIIAHTYVVAKMITEAATKMGMKVPEDYAVACFDARVDEDRSHLLRIEQNEYEIGVQAVNLLLRRIAGENVPSVTLVSGRLAE